MLWQSVLDGGELPLAWAAVRVAMIPKAEGAGQRPLSIAACVWRAGGSVLLAQMKDWIRAWAPPELAGGLPERDLVDVIERIREDLQQSDFLLGTKVDIAKCFDSTSFDQAIAIFKALGAQAPVCEVLRRFYLLHVRFVEIDGACAAHPIEPSRALLQGCPFSPVLLAAVMCLWWKVVQRAGPNVRAGIFVDDRALWIVSAAHRDDLKNALAAGDTVDSALRWRRHPDKGEVFARSEPARRAARDIRRMGPTVRRFKLLGIWCHCDGKKRPLQDAGVLTEVRRRLRRISIATSVRAKRKRLIRSLVISKLSWAGAFNRWSRTTLNGLRLDIEKAVVGQLAPGRSRALAWICDLGPWVDPAFMADLAAVKLERRLAWVKASQSEVHAASTAGLIEETAAWWRWRRTDDTVFETPHGVLDLGYDSWAAIELAARRGWEYDLLDGDKRIRGATTSLALREHDPVFDAHCAWMGAPDASKTGARDVAVGAAPDGRTLRDIQKRKRTEQQGVECACGESTPTRRHLLWHCPRAPPLAQRLRRPCCGLEEGLCVPVAPRLPLAARQASVLPPELLRGLRQARGQGRDRIVAATDGSAQGDHPATRRAAWGVAIDIGNVARGRCVGLDQSAYAGELQALLVLLRCLSAERIGADIFIDNAAVVRGARAAIQPRGSLPRNTPSAWREVRDLARGLPYVAVWWVPSHGKKEDWRAPSHCSTEQCRRLNDLADGAASEAADQAYADTRAEREARRACVVWAQSALEALRTAVRHLVSRYPDLLRTQKWRMGDG
jgi:ribonuclease HI